MKILIPFAAHGMTNAQKVLSNPTSRISKYAGIALTIAGKGKVIFYPAPAD